MPGPQQPLQKQQRWKKKSPRAGTLRGGGGYSLYFMCLHMSSLILKSECYSSHFLKNIIVWLIDLVEREGHIALLFHLLMHSLVDSCMCPDRGWKPRPWHIWTTLKPAELPGQGILPILCVKDIEARRVLVTYTPHPRPGQGSTPSTKLHWSMFRFIHYGSFFLPN